MAPRSKSLWGIVCAANRGEGINFILPRHLHKMGDGTLDVPALRFGYSNAWTLYRLWDCTVGYRFVAKDETEKRAWADAFLGLLRGDSTRYRELMADDGRARAVDAAEKQLAVSVRGA